MFFCGCRRVCDLWSACRAFGVPRSFLCVRLDARARVRASVRILTLSLSSPRAGQPIGWVPCCALWAPGVALGRVRIFMRCWTRFRRFRLCRGSTRCSSTRRDGLAARVLLGPDLGWVSARCSRLCCVPATSVVCLWFFLAVRMRLRTVVCGVPATSAVRTRSRSAPGGRSAPARRTARPSAPSWVVARAPGRRRSARRGTRSRRAALATSGDVILGGRGKRGEGTRGVLGEVGWRRRGGTEVGEWWTFEGGARDPTRRLHLPAFRLPRAPCVPLVVSRSARALSSRRPSPARLGATSIGANEERWRPLLPTLSFLRAALCPSLLLLLPLLLVRIFPTSLGRASRCPACVWARSPLATRSRRPFRSRPRPPPRPPAVSASPLAPTAPSPRAGRGEGKGWGRGWGWVRPDLERRKRSRGTSRSDLPRGTTIALLRLPSLLPSPPLPSLLLLRLVRRLAFALGALVRRRRRVVLGGTTFRPSLPRPFRRASLVSLRACTAA